MRKMNEESWYSREQTAKEYEAYYETKYKRADALEKRLLQKLIEQFDSIEKLLEVGCGTGHFTRWMESLHFDCYGLDVSRPMLDQAKKLWASGKLLQGESSYLPFRSKSMDVVTYVTSFEYMPKINSVLSEVSRVASKGIIFGLLNKWSLDSLGKTLQAKIGRNRYYEKARFYSISDMRRILTATLGKRHHIACWTTTVFPKILDGVESSLFPFGSFLGIAVKLD